MSEFHIECVKIGEVTKHPNADTLSITMIHGGTSVSDWMGETVEEHLVHAEAHVARDNWRNHTRPGEGAPHGRCEEDGLRHLDHAACRIAMAFGREMMVR